MERILEAIDVIDGDADYWFVRTDGGQYFNAFVNGGYIGIGWNYITVVDLSRTVGDVKRKISTQEKLDSTKTVDKRKATDIYNKVLKFQQLKRNDVIVIPSEGSNDMAFGRIADDNVYEELQSLTDCPYVKRRRVIWDPDGPKSFSLLDDAFFQIRKSRHAISSVNSHAEVIDSAMHVVYQKDNVSHFVLNVTTLGSVNWLSLATSLLELHKLLEELNTEFNLNENVASGGSIKIAIQSPGFFNLAQPGFALILAAVVLGVAGCQGVPSKMTPADRAKIDNFTNTKRQELDSIKTDLRSIGVHL